MHTPLSRLTLALVLAFGVAGGAHAQAKASGTAALPVWDGSGKLEAVLLLEPAGDAAVSGNRWQLGSNTLEAAFGVQSGNELGLLCNQTGSLGMAIGNLAENCMLASVGARDQGAARAGASLSRGNTEVGVAMGKARAALPSWLSPGRPASRVDENTLTVYGEQHIGREATVSIGGTWARARLVPAVEVPALAGRWDSVSLTVGADYGDFGANIIGRVVDNPGPAGNWEGVGLGFTWRTPWSGRLTVGAEKLTRGGNPFAPGVEVEDEGTVPYVRYEQDL
ncbi:hypothetical protein [Novilysobacter defluvii]|uniref:Capsule assembly Wzi family protein n=1 Tax=Lysobacter defluvii IMMIB APB-9 = DSM 18482 TaxID=1385515 RepID=A0A0A0MAH1_9GAMM|nr:hypothetical protein [Lysobacter defluvii]KGO99077.1 hypothetical protein N791_12090 [Lysobacter defluvii IMMIB APB-9 = DSM 18482]